MHQLAFGVPPYDQIRQRVAVLQGFRGIGKSQIAREWAVLHQNDYDSIFWLNAKAEQSLMQEHCPNRLACTIIGCS